MYSIQFLKSFLRKLDNSKITGKKKCVLGRREVWNIPGTCVCVCVCVYEWLFKRPTLSQEWNPRIPLSDWLENTWDHLIISESIVKQEAPLGLCSLVCFQGPTENGPPFYPFESTIGISTLRGPSHLSFIPSICQLTTRHLWSTYYVHPSVAHTRFSINNCYLEFNWFIH